MTQKLFGERMYNARVQLNGWTQQHAAQLLGYKTSSPLAKIEMGGKAPQWLVVEASKVYRVSTDYLLGMVDIAHEVSILDAEKKRADALAATIRSILKITFTDAEGKTDFAARVNAILSQCPDTRVLHAVEAEREACAKLCDDNEARALKSQKKVESDDLSDVILRHHAVAHSVDASAIRSRGQQ